jgi:hypothetical protein
MVLAGDRDFDKPVANALGNGHLGGHPDRQVTLILLETGLEQEYRLGAKEVGVIEYEDATAATLVAGHHLGALTKLLQYGAQNMLILHGHPGNVEADVDKRILVLELAGLILRPCAVIGGSIGNARASRTIP